MVQNEESVQILSGTWGLFYCLLSNTGSHNASCSGNFTIKSKKCFKKI